MKALKITATVLVTILSLASCEVKVLMPQNELSPETENISTEKILNEIPDRGDFKNTESKDQPAINNPSVPVETSSETKNKSNRY